MKTIDFDANSLADVFIKASMEVLSQHRRPIAGINESGNAGLIAVAKHVEKLATIAAIREASNVCKSVAKDYEDKHGTGYAMSAHVAMTKLEMLAAEMEREQDGAK